MIRSHKGARDLRRASRSESAVLDPRVNYLMVSLMQEVMRSGTAAGVRSRADSPCPPPVRRAPPGMAGSPGFTSKLICVVWVGFDDGKDLNLEGAKSALPIWTEFMKRAHQHREYRNVRDWDAPDGIVSVDIDPLVGTVGDWSVSEFARRSISFPGTQPVEMCRLHGGGGTQVAGWETTPAPARGSCRARRRQRYTDQGQYRTARTRHPRSGPSRPPPGSRSSAPAEKPKEKKGFFGKIKDIFK